MGKGEMEFSDRQIEALTALGRPEIRECCYGGAKGGGKSVFGCCWSALRAMAIIRRFHLKRAKDPLPVGWMGRRRGSDFRTTTLETWRRFVPKQMWRIREQHNEIIIREAVKIQYGGLDDTGSIQKFNSSQLAFFFLDQAEECSLDDVGELRATLNRLIINGETIAGKALLTANPRLGWLKDQFILAPKPHQVFIQALPADNPWLDPSYVDVLKDSFRHRPGLLRAYLYGDWDSFEGEDQIILSRWIREANARHLHRPSVRRFVTCDVARFGDDETVIYDMEDTDIVGEEIFGKRATTYTANKCFIHQHRMGGVPVVIDATGVGGGPADQLREMGVDVIEFEGAATPRDPKRYVNVRAEAWGEAARGFNEGDTELHHGDPILEGQLCTPQYKFRGGKVLIEKKADIKKRVGRSPDRADAYVQGQWALPMIPGEKARTRPRRRRRAVTDAMAM